MQVERITDRYQTRLDKLLSVFEQRHFTDDKEITKNFAHEPDTDELKIITDILHHVGTDPQERKKIEIEQEARRTIDVMLKGYQKKFEQQLKDLETKNRELETKDKELEIKDKELEIRDKELEIRDKELEIRDKELLALKEQMEELKKQLNK